ncbi:MAG: hypothetical protein ACLVKO_11080 [Dysgonomonas sp.]
MFDLKKYTTLFLDRDGVINIERKNDYVKNRDEFIFIDNSLDAISILTEKFRRIFIVTNQRGIGRNIMTYDDLIDIHKYMLKKIKRTRRKYLTYIYMHGYKSDNYKQKAEYRHGISGKRRLS